MNQIFIINYNALLNTYCFIFTAHYYQFYFTSKLAVTVAWFQENTKGFICKEAFCIEI